jgi:NAD(P)H-hydrate epimerase
MISALEIKVLDINSEFYGVNTSTLMENAGEAVANFINKNYNNKNKLLFFCGTGNNGGDGFVAARYLAKDYKIKLVLMGSENKIKSKIARKNFDKLEDLKIDILKVNQLSDNELSFLLDETDVIVDAMLGTGLSGKPKEPYSSIIKKINSSKKTVISVDVPSGLGSDVAVKPTATITFHNIKEGMNRKNSGIIKVVDIGIPEKAVKFVGPGELIIYYPKPEKNSHKGDNGVVLVVGGGPYIGAPALSGLAALRSGVDLVYILTPSRAAKAITSFSPLLIKQKRLAKDIAKLSPNLIVKELKTNDEKLCPEDVEYITEFLSKSDAVVIGPGLGKDDLTKNAVVSLIKLCVKSKKSIVVDADAFTAISSRLDIIKNSDCVITPHAGEFYTLTKIRLSENLEDRIKKVEGVARRLNITILLKGPIDIISNGKNTKLNEIHNPAMTVGGTGDVLAGIIGAMLAKGVEPFNAARIGAFLNGSAGNLAFKKRSYGLVATDIIDEIPNVLRRYLK